MKHSSTNGRTKLLPRVLKNFFWFALGAMMVIAFFPWLYSNLQQSPSNLSPTDVEATVQQELDRRLTAIATLWTPTPTPDIEQTVVHRLEATATDIEELVQQELDQRLTAIATLWTPTPTPDIEQTVIYRLTATVEAQTIVSTEVAMEQTRLAITATPSATPQGESEANFDFIQSTLALIQSIVAWLWNVVTQLWNLAGSGGLLTQVCCCIVPILSLIAVIKSIFD